MGFDMFGYTVQHRYVDLDGKAVKRTPQTNPYNYDEFVMWKKDKKMSREDIEQKSVVYSDRLWQWDNEKYNECCRAAFRRTGQYFHERKPENIEKFLSLYFEEDITLLLIVQGCNQASGYPYWVFFYDKKAGE